ncbi:Hint domain-containing protein [Pleurocapsa sp. PCC 7319]|uniref:Hint domain-containing protein n=1 Tax=Pleurocapsa sp. PCC 7319 TaxID=118161 RepID=UPI00034DE853|nr:Hint domain-containing protein [Pleurocapsa sp. PCC 7319]
MSEPTNQDQLMLELINRARANPQAEADKLLAGDLNEGLTPGTISTDPKQPLAWNENLISAAVGHTQAMFDQNAINDDDFFAHTNPNTASTISSRAIAAGYTGSVGENISVGVSSGSLDLTDATIARHEGLFVTENTPGRGHRINILNADYREIGISNALGTNYSAGGLLGQEWNHAAIATQEFGFVSGTNPFLTGVVYNDTTDDDFYTVGEGLGNISVQAINSSLQTFSTTTYDSGGYQLQLAPDTYTVSFTGDLDSDGDNDTFNQEVTISSENVKVDIECFLTGTHILTEKGEIAVENLKIGDFVQTANGQLEPIKWIGRQTIKPNQVKNPLRGYPILIKAGALGNKTPSRDLYTSPDHSLFVEGLLINAGALVNNISIIKTKPIETFTYFHIELANHALLVAEGTLAESYLPQKENRNEYDNCAEYEQLYPHGSNLMLWPMDYPRVSSKNKVPRFVSKKLMAITEQLTDREIKLRA